jgi:hypothetical protein
MRQLPPRRISAKGAEMRGGDHGHVRRYYDADGARRRKSPFPSKSAALAHFRDAAAISAGDPGSDRRIAGARAYVRVRDPVQLEAGRGAEVGQLEGRRSHAQDRAAFPGWRTVGAPARNPTVHAGFSRVADLRQSPGEARACSPVPYFVRGRTP